jgi:hypothetical protein
VPLSFSIKSSIVVSPFELRDLFFDCICGSLYFGAVANGFSVRSKKHEIAIPLSYNLSFASYPLQQGLLRQRFSST